jgi:uncharacterized membrane protein YphA (DoxX/SURF4 family)
MREDTSDRALNFVNAGSILFLVVVFLFTGIDKALHYSGFVNAIRDYVLVPRETAQYVAIPVIMIEIMIAIGLLVKPMRRFAAGWAAAILIVFTIAVALNHAFGRRGICGCWFTITLAQGTTMHILQNLLMLGLAVMVWLAARDANGRASSVS